MNPAPPPPLRRPWLPPLLVGLVTFLVFLPALWAGWTNRDDDINFLNNPHYRGLSPQNLKWMWTTYLMGHYHPVTWMSLGVDYLLWGMTASGYHFTSVALHAANAVLLYFVLAALLRLCGQDSGPWPAVAGALFHSLHPLRVESVAWITERRDVMCGLFTLLTLLFYLKRVEEERRGRPGTRWLGLALAAFAGALLSKALAIMLPAVLLILDVYPFRRFVPGSRLRILLEKTAFGLVSCADAVVMFFAMRHISAVRSIETYDVLERAAQAAYALCFYPVKTLWPSGLIPIHRVVLPMSPGEAKYVAAMTAVVALTGLLIAVRKRLPGGLAAWLAYVALVLPVTGIAVTGRQIAADRYTYLALLPAAAGAAALLARASLLDPRARRAILAGAAGVLVALSAVSVRQIGFWNDSIALWSRQIAVDPDWARPWNNRGGLRLEQGDLKGAWDDTARALELEPRYDKALTTRGMLRLKSGDPAGARADFDLALESNPANAIARTNRGDLRRSRGDLDGAFEDAQTALTSDPHWGMAYVLRGMVRRARGDLAGALLDLDRGVELSPGSIEALNNRATLHLQSRRPREAARDYESALALKPDNPPVLVGRGQARMLLGDKAGAATDFEQALRLAPPGWPLRGDVEALLQRVR